ncbi:MAG: FAD-binding protein [Chloroflexi bacterium]|nr:GMC family oxidoreductase N-terminal domain-containing protein [Ardenticatenaceae bacterium]NOG33665.1 FAD-binding protein [Chloroflexota bacterium]GIK56623.1 MAG: GMC oxidoreductase [Chloroflexota bacterium]
MPFLNTRQKHTLSRLADTLIPALEVQDGEDERLFGIRASDLNIGELAEAKLEAIATAHRLKEIRFFLRLLEMPLVNLLLAGQWGRFSAMNLERRTAVLRTWGNSRLAARRRAFQSLKRVIIFLFYAVMPDGKPNPTWPVFAYTNPPPGPAEQPRPIQPLTVTGDTVLETAVLIIGSGAGGGVVAGELSAAGLDVLVVEKGGYYAESDYTGQELAGYNHLYENEGALTTADLSTIVLAGSALGGGTTVNWLTSLIPPDVVLADWAAHGFTAAATSEFQDSLTAVSARTGINTQESEVNRQNELLAQGAQALGYQVGVIPRNVQGCVDCTFCNYGCIYGAKQSTLKTYLQDAFDRGGRMLLNAHADRILHQNGRVTGAVVTVTQNGQQHRLTIQADMVVAAAGAIHTPALLRRSGLHNKHIGQHLHLHPVTQTWGIYAEPVYSWQGAPQTRVIHDFANLDGRGYGVWLETSPGHPGSYTSSLPWQSGRQHKRLVQRLHHLANHIVLTRDFYGGQVRLDKQGQPVLHYHLHKYDAHHLWQGIVESFKIHRAAGVQRLIAPHNRYITWQPGEDFETFLAKVRQQGFPPNGYGLFSAHQMSTCRIGSSPATGALKPTGETYEVRNLWVADASVFPTAVGVNPMLAVMAAAHYIAGQIRDGNR